MFLTQPGLSKQVKDLEIYLHTKLFERAGKQLVLTPTGKILYKACNEMFSTLDNARDAINDFNNLQAGTIRVNAGHTPGIHVLPKAILAFRKKYDKISVTFDISTTANIFKKILENQIDLGIVAEEAEDIRLICKPFMEDELVLVLPRGHLLEKKDILHVRDLVHYQLLMTKAGSATRNLIESINRKMHQQLTITEIGSPFAIVKTIETGHGISIMSRLAVENEANQEKVIYRKIKDLPSNRKYYLVYHNKKYIYKALEYFMEMVTHFTI